MQREAKVQRQIDEKLEGKVPPIEGKDASADNDDAGTESAEEENE